MEDLINDHNDDNEQYVNFEAAKNLQQWHKEATSPLADIAKRQRNWQENQTPPLADVARKQIDKVTAPLRNMGLEKFEWPKQISEPLTENVMELTEGVGKQIHDAAHAAKLPNVKPPRSVIASQQQMDYLALHQKQMDEIIETRQREKEEAVERERRLVALLEQQEKREQQRDEQAQAQRQTDIVHRRHESRKTSWALFFTVATFVAAVVALFIGG